VAVQKHNRDAGVRAERKHVERVAGLWRGNGKRDLRHLPGLNRDFSESTRLPDQCNVPRTGVTFCRCHNLAVAGSGAPFALWRQVPADGQINLVVRYSDGHDPPVGRLDDQPIESARAGRDAVGYDSSSAESGIETSAWGQPCQGVYGACAS